MRYFDRYSLSANHIFRTQGLIDIVALTAAAGACGVLFYRVNKTAGLIFVPYMAWLGFATALNYAMWKLNPEKKDEKPATEQKLN